MWPAYRQTDAKFPVWCMWFSAGTPRYTHTHTHTHTSTATHTLLYNVYKFSIPNHPETAGSDRRGSDQIIKSLMFVCLSLLPSARLCITCIRCVPLLVWDLYEAHAHASNSTPNTIVLVRYETYTCRRANLHIFSPLRGDEGTQRGFKPLMNSSSSFFSKKTLCPPFHVTRSVFLHFGGEFTDCHLFASVIPRQ